MILYFYFSIDNIPKVDSNVTRTEKQPILDRFQKLNNVSRSYWKAGVIGQTNFGPTPYWMKGILELVKDDALRFSNDFEWEDVPHSWKPSFEVEQINLNDSEWSQSKDFNRYFLPAGYVGTFYLERHKGMIYFEIEK